MVRRLPKILVAFILMSSLLSVSTANAMPSSSVLINEIQIDGTTSKYQEFIELVNISEDTIVLAGWHISVKNVDDTECTVSKPFLLDLSGLTINAHGILLIAAQKDSTQYFSDLNPAMYYSPCSGSSSVLAAEKKITILDDTNQTIDSVVVSNNATNASLNPIPYVYDAKVNVSFERVLDETTGLPQDSDNSLQDFMAGVPTPGVLQVLPDPEEPPVDPLPVPDDPEDVPENTEETPMEPPVDSPTETPVSPPLLPIQINELFIDPVSPQTDAQDEFVELYNPNTLPVDISKYVIYAGETFSYRYIFADGTSIPAQGYIVVTSGSSSLAFANGGGAAKLVTPSGEIIETVTYESAPAGQSWSKDVMGIWQWTTTPTQGTVNIITVPITPAVVAKAVSSAKKSTKATTTSTKATTTKVAAAKTTKAKTVVQDTEGAALIAAPSPIPFWLLAVLGLLAVLYSTYEYRYDISNKLYQFRKYRTDRKNYRR